MSSMFDRFKDQLISSDLGDLRTRQKYEWMAKVSAHSYHAEKQKLASERWAPTAERLVKKARLVAIGKVVEGRIDQLKDSTQVESR